MGQLAILHSGAASNGGVNPYTSQGGAGGLPGVGNSGLLGSNPLMQFVNNNQQQNQPQQQQQQQTMPDNTNPLLHGLQQIGAFFGHPDQGGIGQLGQSVFGNSGYPAGTPMGGLSAERSAARTDEFHQAAADHANDPNWLNANPQPPQAQQQQTPQISWNDRLNQALGLVNGQANDMNNIYAQQAAQMKNNAIGNDANLSGMYAQLQQSYANDLPKVAALYNNAGSAIQGNGQSAQQDTNAAYAAANQTQQNELAKLGISAASGNNLQNNFAANDQAHAIGDIAQNTNSNSNANTENAATAQSYTQGVGQAAGLEGATQRALLAQNTNKQLSDLALQHSQQLLGLFPQAMSLAGQMYGNDINTPQAQAAIYAARLGQQQTQQQIDAGIGRMGDLSGIVNNYVAQQNANGGQIAPQDMAKLLSTISQARQVPVSAVKYN